MREPDEDDILGVERERDKEEGPNDSYTSVEINLVIVLTKSMRDRKESNKGKKHDNV